MKLSGEERRKKIVEILKNSTEPISGSKLSEMLDVSRQVIVTDIALLRSKSPQNQLISTNSGYIISSSKETNDAPKRIFKVSHTDEQIEDELSTITDMGGTILNVFIQHKVYGTITVPLNVSNRRDIQNFLNDLKSGVSTPLKNITNNFHYHTISAKTDTLLDEIESKLRVKGYLLETNVEAPVYEAKNYSLV